MERIKFKGGFTMEIKKNLIGEFDARLEDFGELDLKSDEYKKAVDNLTKIADRIIEIDKIEVEREKNQIENDLKTQQMNDEKRDRLVRNVIEGAKVVGGFGLAAWAFVASMNFEKEGTFTTQGGRSAVNQLLKFIKF